MSKSLGNVLDPNEVVERFGADALRFYCFREVSFGQDGNVSAAGFEARYETELANDWGNLASRTLAMIERYRDGVVPDARARSRARRRATTRSTGIDGVVRELLDRAELTQALEAIWSRVRRLNRYVEENAALGPGQGRRRRPSASTRSSTTSPRGSGCWRCCCIPTCRRPAAGCSRRSPRATASSTPSAPAAAASDRADPAAVPEAAIAATPDSSPWSTPTAISGSASRPTPSWSPTAASVGVRRMLTVGHRRGRERAGDRDRRAPRAGPRERRSPPERRRAASTMPPPTRLEELARHPRVAAVGETGLDYYRDRAPRDGSAARLRRPDRDRPPSREAARDPRPRLGQTTDGEALDRAFELLAAEATGVDRDPALLLGAARARAPRPPSTAGTARSRATSPIRTLGRAARGRGRGAGGAAAGRDRLAVPRPAAACAASPTSRPTSSPPPSAVAEARGIAYHELEAIVEANAARVFGW